MCGRERGQGKEKARKEAGREQKPRDERKGRQDEVGQRQGMRKADQRVGARGSPRGPQPQRMETVLEGLRGSSLSPLRGVGLGEAGKRETPKEAI